MKPFEKLTNKLHFIITGIVIIILAFMMFVVINFHAEYNSEFWAQLAFGMVLQIGMIAAWLPQGKVQGHLDSDVVATKAAAGEKMKIANNADLYDQLAEFCELATAENRHVWICNKSAKLGVNYDKWLKSEEYRSNFPDGTAKKIDRFVKLAESRVKPIKDTEITSVSRIALQYDTHDYTKRSGALHVSAKIVLSAAISFFSSMLMFDKIAFNIEGLIDFAYWCAVVAMTIFYSLRTGKALITNDYKGYLLRMCDFLDRYKAWLHKNNYIKEEEKASAPA